MTPNTPFSRIAGWAAIVSPLLYIASIGSAIASGGAPSPVGMALISVSTLLLLVVLAALYLTHRRTTPVLSIFGVLALAASNVGGLFLDPSAVTPIVGMIGLLFAIGMLVLGWLALRSPEMPRGLVVLALITGALALIQAVIALTSASPDLFGLLNVILTVPYTLWLLWLGRRWLVGAPSLQSQSR